MKVIIFGVGGLAKVICEAIEMEGSYEVAGFLDDNKKGKFLGYPILGKCSGYAAIFKKMKIENAIIAFGYYFLKERLFYCKDIAKRKNLKFINAIHPDAVVSKSVKIGSGVYIGPRVVINPDTKIGDNSVIWSGSIIEHDNVIGKNVFITPGVITAGYVKIGDNSFLGMGSAIVKAVLGEHVTIGAGSLVLTDVPSNKYLLGNPARIIKTKDKVSYV